MLAKYPHGVIGVGGVAGGLYLRRLRQILNLELQAEFNRRVDEGGQRGKGTRNWQDCPPSCSTTENSSFATVRSRNRY